VTQAPKRIGVIGYPISHSLSPRIHNYWLKQHHINVTYEAIEVKPDHLQSFLQEMRNGQFIGVNVTIPHKETTFGLVDELQGALTSQIGAINTVIAKNQKLIGANTDDYGFFKNLETLLPAMRQKAVIIGAGGAARAICLRLLHAGYDIILINRTKERAEALVTHLGSPRIKVMGWEKREEALAQASLLVNVTSLGMKGQPELDISLENLPKDALVTDIVYNPIETGLLKQAKAHGNNTVDGLGMLLYQAQMAFNLWFDVLPEVTIQLRNHVLEALR
jgi:shikimate dehydrogenase